MKTLKLFGAAVLGWALGSFVFLMVVVFIFGRPMTDWLGSTFGIFVHRTPPNLDPPSWDAAVQLLQRGIIVTPEALISNITTTYGIMIQVLLGVLVVVGFLSFFAIRWQSIQQAENFIDQKLEKIITSDDFSRLLSNAASEVFDLQSEPLQEQLAHIALLDDRLSKIESMIAEKGDDREPQEEDNADNGCTSPIHLEATSASRI